MKILAIDFETAHSLDDIKGKNAKVQSSGCALGLAMYDSDTGRSQRSITNSDRNRFIWIRGHSGSMGFL